MLLALVGYAGLSAAAPQENGDDALPFSKLTLEIGSTKDEFVPLEPIPISLKLENRMKKPALGHTALGFSENYIQLFAISPEGSAKKIDIAKPVAAFVHAAPRIFQPGESHASMDLLTVGRNDILSPPGEYRIQAVIHGANSHDQVKSNLLFIRVTEPTGANRLALDFIMRESSLPNLFAGYDLSEDQQAVKTLEGLSNDFIENAYWTYASFRAGEFYFYKNDYAKAKQYFDKLAERADFIFADRVLDFRNKIHAKLADLK